MGLQGRDRGEAGFIPRYCGERVLGDNVLVSIRGLQFYDRRSGDAWRQPIATTRCWPIVRRDGYFSRAKAPYSTNPTGSRIFRWYGQLRGVEDRIGTRDAEELLRELAGIEQRVEQVTVPLSYADELYALRTHIQMVGNRLRAGLVAAPPS